MLGACRHKVVDKSTKHWHENADIEKRWHWKRWHDKGIKHGQGCENTDKKMQMGDKTIFLYLKCPSFVLILSWFSCMCIINLYLSYSQSNDTKIEYCTYTLISCPPASCKQACTLCFHIFNYFVPHKQYMNEQIIWRFVSNNAWVW